jgi:hypothetical protein
MVAESSPTAAELEKMKVSDLKELCKEHNCKVSGRKQELIDRLLEAFASDDDILLLEDDEELFVGEPIDDAEVIEDSKEEVFEAEVFEAIIEDDLDDELYIDESEEEVFEAEVFEAELFEDEPLLLELPHHHDYKENH